MFTSTRGVVVKINGKVICIEWYWSYGDSLQLTCFDLWEHATDLNVGDWVDVSGGGFAGRYSYEKLKVFA